MSKCLNFYLFSYHSSVLMYKRPPTSNKKDDDIMVDLPPLSIPRSGHACTIIDTKEQKRLLVVAGGTCNFSYKLIYSNSIKF